MKLYFKRLNGAVEQERFAINLLTLYSSTLKKQKKTKPKEKQTKKPFYSPYFMWSRANSYEISRCCKSAK